MDNYDYTADPLNIDSVFFFYNGQCKPPVENLGSIRTMPLYRSADAVFNAKCFNQIIVMHTCTCMLGFNFTFPSPNVP